MARQRPAECECKSPPTVMYAGEWMCERCRRLQRESREVKQRYAHGERVPEKGAYVAKGRTTQNFQEWLDFEPIIWPDSIARLESMLAMGLQKVIDSILYAGVEPTPAASLAGRSSQNPTGTSA